MKLVAIHELLQIVMPLLVLLLQSRLNVYLQDGAAMTVMVARSRSLLLCMADDVIRQAVTSIVS